MAKKYSLRLTSAEICELFSALSNHSSMVFNRTPDEAGDDPEFAAEAARVSGIQIALRRFMLQHPELHRDFVDVAPYSAQGLFARLAKILEADPSTESPELASHYRGLEESAVAVALKRRTAANVRSHARMLSQWASRDAERKAERAAKKAAV
jgi:hypothetical protein